jgi:phospholipid/cholesterol/gamma-HCH transport system substrate-binding protein
MPGRHEKRLVKRSLIAGILALAAVSFILYLATTAHTGMPWSRYTTVRASFTKVDSLQAGNDVRQNSYRIGQVLDISYQDGNAVVTLQLDGDKAVYSDARAQLWDLSTLGTKFVELDPGHPASGPLGSSIIPAAHTVPSSNLYQVFNIFEPKTRQAATSLIRELGQGTAGLGPNLQDYLRHSPDLLNDIGVSASALASSQANLPELLRAADQLSSRFGGRQQEIAALVKQSDVTFRAVDVDETKPLASTLDKLPQTLSNAKTAFDQLRPPLTDTQSAMQALGAGAEALGEATPDTRGVLRESRSPLVRVPDVADDARPAVKDLTDTFNDARPLGSRLRKTFTDLDVPVAVLAPYANELASLFHRGRSFLSENIDGLHYARLALAPGQRSGAGPFLSGPPSTPHQDYPAPGQADRTRWGFGGSR